MMNYKQIGDNLSINEFNAFVSLLRNNIVFDENIRITKSNVKGVYGDYNFNFREATILDNGILITNETLSAIGTVKLVNPVFPNSNYYLDLKVYSSKDIGVIGLDSEDIIITPLTIKLSMGVEVNIPFETLEMNNIIGFDATVRIDHKDLVIRGTDRLVLTSFSRALPYVPIPLSATYTDADGIPVSGKSINFYDGETLLGTGVTNDGGIATITCTFSNLGNHRVRAYCDTIHSNVFDIVIVNDADMKFRVNNDFATYVSNPFKFTGEGLIVSFGDNTREFYSSGKLSHDYASGGDYTVNIVGNITKLNDMCFRDCTSLTSIEIPSSVTSIGRVCFTRCTSLTSITIPDSVTTMLEYCFFYCTSLNKIRLNWTTPSTIIPYNKNWIEHASSSLKFIIPEGTTSLYVSKGYPSDKLKEDVSFDGIHLTSNKSILSAEDGDSATLTAQLTNGGSPVGVSGETVTFEVRKQSDDSLVETLTGVTDSSGIATVSYLGKAMGNLYIKSFSANRMIVSETYDIIDAKYHASNSRIELEGVDYNNQRLIFVSDYEVSYDDVIHFRFGDTVPTNCGVGISSKSYSNDVFIEKTGSTTKLYRIGSYNPTISNPFVANHDFCMKPVESTTAGANDQCWLYDNDNYINWYNFKLINKKVRVDKYYSYPFTIEIIVL